MYTECNLLVILTKRSMARGNPKVTGPQANDSADMLAANELAKELYDSGYDYSHNENGTSS